MPSYVKAIEFIDNNLENFNDVYLIIPIISNDFDESFREYQPTGIGFYFKKDNSGYEHVPYPKTTSSEIRRALLNNIAFARYLLININAAEIMHKYPICKLWLDCAPGQKYAANVIEETEEENPKRYYHGYLATKYFLNNLSKVRSSLASRNKTIFVVDSDRHNIYDKKNTKSVYFDTQRKNFISEAKSMGFTVIDTEEIFIEDYKINKNKFEFINDNHWNKRGHRLVAERILTELKRLLRIKNSEKF